MLDEKIEFGLQRACSSGTAPASASTSATVS